MPSGGGGRRRGGRMRTRRGGGGVGGRRRRVGERGEWDWFGIIAVIVIIAIFMFITLLATIEVLHSPQSSTDPELQTTITYAPGETRFSPSFIADCENVSITNLTNIGATLYLLDTLPELTERDEFTIEVESLTLMGRHFLWYSFYLYPGSNASVQYCQGSTQQAEFNFIKTMSNFESWSENPSGHFAEEHFTITNNCVDGTVERFYDSSDISNEEDYYFVFFNPGSNEAVINGMLQFERTKYGVPANSIVTQCSTNESSECNLTIPLNGSRNNTTLLLVVDPPPDGDYGANVDVTWECLDS